MIAFHLYWLWCTLAFAAGAGAMALAVTVFVRPRTAREAVDLALAEDDRVTVAEDGRVEVARRPAAARSRGGHRLAEPLMDDLDARTRQTRRARTRRGPRRPEGEAR